MSEEHNIKHSLGRLPHSNVRSFLHFNPLKKAELAYHTMLNPRHSFPAGTDADILSFEVLPCLLDIGEAMLTTGADVNLIERTLRHMGYAYGATKMNVLVITASIIVTITLPSGSEHTQTRRIENAPTIDYDKLTQLTQLCDRCIANPLKPDALRREYAAINKAIFPRAMLYIGGVLSTSSFAIFFGGSLLDGFVSAIFALFICLMIEHLRPLTPNTIVFNFIASVVTGLAVGLVAHSVPGVSPDMVMIGDIMLLIPGAAMTNATRDMISGDTISGVMRFIESLLWTIALVLGFMVALWMVGVSGSPVVSNGTPQIQLLAAFPATLGFAFFFNIRKDHLLFSMLGGVLAVAVWLMFKSVIPGPFAPCLIASIFAAIYAEVLCRYYRAPISPFFIVAVIPLIPGRGLFYTMQSAVQENWPQFQAFAFSTLMYAVAIACGISVVWAFSQTWYRFSEMQYKKEHTGEIALDATTES